MVLWFFCISIYVTIAFSDESFHEMCFSVKFVASTLRSLSIILVSSSFSRSRMIQFTCTCMGANRLHN